MPVGAIYTNIYVINLAYTDRTYSILKSFRSTHTLYLVEQTNLIGVAGKLRTSGPHQPRVEHKRLQDKFLGESNLTSIVQDRKFTIRKKQINKKTKDEQKTELNLIHHNNVGHRCVLHQHTEACQMITVANSVGRVDEIYITTFSGPQASVSEKNKKQNIKELEQQLRDSNVIKYPLLNSCIITNMETVLADSQLAGQ